MDERYVRYQGRYKKKSPARGEHLKQYQWKPGQSGNPSGRPNGSVSLAEQLKAALRRQPELAESIVRALVTEAITGNMMAIKEAFDRVDGKATETHKIEGELPIRIELVPAASVLGETEETAKISLEVPVEEPAGLLTEYAQT